MNYTLKNESIAAYNESNKYEFPKYTSQLINWANQNAQGTRPVVVGQMSELFPEFVTSGEEVTIENWHNGIPRSTPILLIKQLIRFLPKFKTSGMLYR